MNTAGCESKKQYPSFTLAARAAKYMHRRTSNRVQPYQCQRCGYFHCGSMTGPGNLARQLRAARLERIRDREDWRTGW